MSIRDVAVAIGSNRETVRKLLVSLGLIRDRLSFQKSWEDRVLENIEPDLNSGCWIWSGAVNNMGYGRLSVNGKPALAHRAMYALWTGAWPKASIDLCHKCDTPPCVNPAHLFPGTRGENMRDASRKGRLRVGEKSPAAKHPDKLVEEVRRLWAMGMSQSDIGREIGASNKWVHAVVRGRARTRK